MTRRLCLQKTLNYSIVLKPAQLISILCTGMKTYTPEN